MAKLVRNNYIDCRERRRRRSFSSRARRAFIRLLLGEWRRTKFGFRVQINGPQQRCRIVTVLQIGAAEQQGSETVR